MGRHVERMRRGRRDLRVTPSGGQSLLGHPRDVVTMNQVVSDARMIRFEFEEFLQNLGGLFAVDMSVIIVIRCDQSPSVKGGCFAILGKLAGQSLHRLVEGLGALVFVIFWMR